jgi:hypothetical protein
MTAHVLHIGVDVQLRIEPTAEGSVDLRLFRRSPSEVSADGFHSTQAGLRVPLHRVPEVVAALAESAAEMAAEVVQAAVPST